MKRFSATGSFVVIMLATALCACGSTSAPSGSSTTSTTTSGATTTTTSTATSGGNTTISNANNASNANATASGTATVSVTGNLGGIAFTGKDAIYAVDTTDGISIVTAVVSDTADLCNAFGGASSLDGNLIVVQLLNATGGALTTGDYTVTDSNSTDSGTTNAGSTLTAAAGIGAVSLLTSGANGVEVDASSGDVNVTSYSTNNPLVFTLSAEATGDTAGLTGNVSAPACAALATALQSSATTNASAKLVKARRVIISNVR